MNYNRLVLFGDSYAIEYEHNEYCWYKKLSEMLEISKILNFAIKGSSLEFSISALYKYINSPQYSTDDLIIFVPTAYGRNPFVGDNIDPECAFFLKVFLSGRYDKKIRFHKHYTENKVFYDTLFDMMNEESFKFQMFTLAMTLKQLPNMTVLLPAFDNYFKNHPLLTPSDNFMIADLVLFRIDKAEIDSPEYYDLRYFFKGDPRYCHMTKTNNIILASQLYCAITHNDINFFNDAEFKTKIIKLSAEFEHVFRQELQPIYINYKTQSSELAMFGKTSLF